MNYVDSVFGAKMFDGMERSLIGFERVFDTLSNTRQQLKTVTNYPPYNIKRTADDKFVIELAVAGFSEEDIDITLERNQLTISGNLKDTDKNDYLFKGLATRAFKRLFTLDDQVVVVDATMKNGILSVNLERVIPEHAKPRKILIGTSFLKNKIK